MAQVNKNHRQRLKDRFSKSGLKGFHDYEVLEMLLFYIFPRIDTKPLAKALIKKFGSFSKVLDAECLELENIKGMGVKSASSLKVMREILLYYFEDKIRSKPFKISNMQELAKYVRAKIAGKKNEQVLLIFLNSKNEVILSMIITEGTVNQSFALPRRIVEEGIKCGAVALIMAHNHPGGNASPSPDDIELTREIRKSLELVEINLLDHIIINDSEYFSFSKKGFL